MLAVLKAFFMAKESAEDPDEIEEDDEMEPATQEETINEMEEEAMKRGAVLMSDEEAEEELI